MKQYFQGLANGTICFLLEARDKPKGLNYVQAMWIQD